MHCMTCLIKYIYIYIYIYGDPRTEEGIAELLVLLLRHHVPKEGIHLKRGGEETKVSWELQVGRIGGGERFMESRGSFQ